MSGPPGVRKSRNLMAVVSARLITPVREWRTVIEDVSLSGLRVRRPEDYGPDVAELLEAEMTIRDMPALRLRARLMRLGETDLAFRFERLSPMLEAELRALIKRYGELRDSFR